MNDTYDFVIKWASIALLVAGAALLAWKMSGHSPTFEVILSVILGAIVVNQFGYERRMAHIEVKLDNFAGQFRALASDFKEHAKGGRK